MSQQKFNYLTQNQRSRFTYMYRRHLEFSVREIGETFGIHDDRVARWARKLGLTLRTAGNKVGTLHRDRGMTRRRTSRYDHPD